MGRPPQYEYSHFVGLSVSWYIHIESNIAVVYGGLAPPPEHHHPHQTHMFADTPQSRLPSTTRTHMYPSEGTQMISRFRAEFQLERILQTIEQHLLKTPATTPT